ncbi:MAG: SGNH/GDSL hydrolase family protein [Candidatus Omnitrophica bacterium]|nr:SGNH/GDSL hydrolase family protein [Candidatus Omnitrophota bacterium]
MFKKLFILFSSIFFALLIGEAIVRHYKLSPVMLDSHIVDSMYFDRNPNICYRMKPNSYNGLNKDGFRDNEFALTKLKDTIRIIMLGDSITFGVPADKEHTFAQLLEKNLKEKNQLAYDVMNLGIPGYNIVSEVELLKVFGIKYKPDIVILNFFWNDSDLYPYTYYDFFWDRDGTPAQKRWTQRYYSSTYLNLKRYFLRSHLFSLLLSALDKIKDTNNFELGKYKNRRIDNDSSLLDKKIAELNTLAIKHNFKLLICLHPVFDYDTAKAHSNYKKLKDIARQLNIAFIDLLPFYIRESADPRIFIENPKDTFHPNTKGHELIARILAEKLKELKWIEN